MTPTRKLSDLERKANHLHAELRTLWANAKAQGQEVEAARLRMAYRAAEDTSAFISLTKKCIPTTEARP